MSSTFASRRLRARKWLERQPPAAAMLELYLGLLDLQEPLYTDALAGEWDVGTQPSLLLERLPVVALMGRFRRFVQDLTPAVTPGLAALARSLEEAGAAVETRLLEDFLHRRPLDGLASELGGEAVSLEFFPRAFLQPIVQALAEKGAGAAGTVLEKSCPRCGCPPLAGVLRDEPEAKGERLLVCALCGGWWRFRRSECPKCGETDPEKLAYHVSESLPHMRVDECQSCRAYLKSVDLRKDGLAVPEVEDLATVELDLWCAERGFEKIQRNLMGL